MALLLCPEMITALVDVDSCSKIVADIFENVCGSISEMENECFTICLSVLFGNMPPGLNQCYTITCLLFTP